MHLSLFLECTLLSIARIEHWETSQLPHLFLAPLHVVLWGLIL